MSCVFIICINIIHILILTQWIRPFKVQNSYRHSRAVTCTSKGSPVTCLSNTIDCPTNDYFTPVLHLPSTTLTLSRTLLHSHVDFHPWHSINRTFLHSHLAITVYRIDPERKVVFTSPVARNRWLLHSSPSITVHGTDPDPDRKQISTSFPIHVWFLLPSAWITA